MFIDTLSFRAVRRTTTFLVWFRIWTNIFHHDRYSSEHDGSWYQFSYCSRVSWPFTFGELLSSFTPVRVGWLHKHSLLRCFATWWVVNLNPVTMVSTSRFRVFFFCVDSFKPFACTAVNFGRQCEKERCSRAQCLYRPRTWKRARFFNSLVLPTAESQPHCVSL